MPFVCTIASGSSGNAAVVSDGKTHILIDAGVSCKRLLEGLGAFDICPADIAGIVITHEHSDHIKGLDIFCKKTDAPVYMTGGTARGVLRRSPGLHSNTREISAGSSFEIGGIGVFAFSTPHDAPDSVGYTFSVAGKKIAYATDLGHVTQDIRDAVIGAEYICIESNHDLMMLLGGPYPEYLKSRIMSRRGHLSNDDCSDFLTDAVNWGAREIFLCHLSKENNTPDIAYEQAMEAVMGLGATNGDGISVCVAPPDALSRVCSF